MNCSPQYAIHSPRFESCIRTDFRLSKAGSGEPQDAAQTNATIAQKTNSFHFYDYLAQRSHVGK